jgi:glycosyltransferase involved in cell wall biosynthesis
LKSKKAKVVGQGIDTAKFAPMDMDRPKTFFKIITVGRISPIKDYETLIKAIELAKDKIPNLQIEIIGGPGNDDQRKYLAGLKDLVIEKKLDKIINFLGPLPSSRIIECLRPADLFVNTSHTGSLDKAILEAMACGVLVLTCNEAMIDVLEGYREKLMFPGYDVEVLADKIEMIYKMKNEEKAVISEDLRKIVLKNNNLPVLISKIISNY